MCAVDKISVRWCVQRRGEPHRLVGLESSCSMVVYVFLALYVDVYRGLYDSLELYMWFYVFRALYMVVYRICFFRVLYVALCL